MGWVYIAKKHSLRSFSFFLFFVSVSILSAEQMWSLNCSFWKNNLCKIVNSVCDVSEQLVGRCKGGMAAGIERNLLITEIERGHADTAKIQDQEEDVREQEYYESGTDR